MSPAARRLLTVLCVAWGTCPAAGGQVTTTLDVKATIVAECQLTNLTPLDFGTFGVLTAPIDAVATFKLQCTAETSYAIGITAGVGAPGGDYDTANRSLYGDISGLVAYDLYRNAARDQHWGFTDDKLTGIGTGAAETVTIYGRIPVQTSPAAEGLEDFCLVAVTY